ncbi:membrane protein insertase YidC [Frigoribacterium salinisoli]
MDPSTFPPLAVVLDGLSALVGLLADLVAPLAGASAAALAVVLLTALVRLVLVPVAVSQVRAELARRRLAPQVAELGRRHRDPQARGRALQELYAAEGVSPFAGCLPTLAQAPVLACVYALFAHPTAGGAAASVLDGTLAGAPLDGGLVAALAAGPAAAATVLGLLGLLAAVTELSRRASVRATGAAGGVPGQDVPGLAPVLRLLPFVTVVVAAVVPLAAGLYVVTSATWTLGERAVLRRLLGRRATA